MKKRLNFLCTIMLLLIIAEIVLAFKGTVFDSYGKIAIPWDNSEFRIFIIVFIVLCIVLLYPAIRSMVSFIRFIWNVNRDKVFVKENIPLLRWSGWGLLYAIIIEFPAILINQKMENKPVSLTSAFEQEYDAILLAVLLLIIAEVFVIGIKLREEQELTI